MGRDDEDTHPGGGEGSPIGDDPFSLNDLVIPDDPRELAAEVRALQRERRSRARREWLRRIFLTRRWRQYGVSGPIVIAVLVVVTAFASLMVLFQPRRTPARPAPLATGVRDAGEEGGLLPDVSVQPAEGPARSVRSYRPAVLALLPSSCGCESRLRPVAVAALRHQLTVVLLAATMPQPPAGMSDPGLVRAVEPAGVLSRRYRLHSDPLLLLVRGDGVVNRILAESPTTNALEGELAVLVATGSG